jgi:K+-sensing histidine kinase KdpD
MIVSRNSWHWHLYKASTEIITRTFRFIHYDMDASRVDLCSYMRAMLLLAPLSLAVTVAFWGWAFFVLLYTPFFTENKASFVILVMIAILTTVIVSIVALMNYLGNKFNQAASNRSPRPPKQPNLFWEYLKAMKARICPILEIK